MNHQEYDEYLADTTEPPRLRAAQFPPPTDDSLGYTLTFGYDHRGNDVHVYLHGGEIHLLVHDGWSRIHHQHGDTISVFDARPPKRAYIDATDLHFARLMRDAGFPLTFPRGVSARDMAAAAERAALGPFKGPTHLDTRTPYSR